MTETTPWMTRDEAAGYARVHVKTIDRWADDGAITRHKVGETQSVRFRREELDALMRPVGGAQ